jgi:hypothetical protein
MSFTIEEDFRHCLFTLTTGEMFRPVVGSCSKSVFNGLMKKSATVAADNNKYV